MVLQRRRASPVPFISDAVGRFRWGFVGGEAHPCDVVVLESSVLSYSPPSCCLFAASAVLTNATDGLAACEGVRTREGWLMVVKLAYAMLCPCPFASDKVERTRDMQSIWQLAGSQGHSREWGT